ncbi:GntR family transcriptional regulator [Rathayibacter sp. CAU 1779]
MRASDVAYQRLRDDIIEWNLEPGTLLGEIETAQRLGVSRTPVREALSRLMAEGLVSSGTGRTAMVSLVSLSDVKRLFEYRVALETQAARLAASRRDPAVFEQLRERFLGASVTTTSGAKQDLGPSTERPYSLADELDDAIDAATDNPYLVRALRDLRGHLARYRRHARTNPARLDDATKEHLIIVEAILSGDGTLASQATAVHLHRSLENILATVPALQRQRAESATGLAIAVG